LYDFLTFNTFIAQKVLVVFYYMFAIFIPICCFMMKNYFKKVKFFRKIYDLSWGIYGKLHLKYKILIILMFFMAFFMFELFLRMFFEMLIGYFDMHDYLHQLVSKV
jgi:hypothetical protein